MKKLLRAMPSKFLQITSSIEQFRDLDAMSVEEAIGSLKAHEERLHGQTENTGGGQLLLTEEEWLKRENNEGKLLFTREEWMKRSRGGVEAPQGQKNRGTNAYQGVRDRRKIRCFNCQAHGHYAAECRRPQRAREQRPEANLTQIQDDEPALLVAEKEVVPKVIKTEIVKSESHVWY